MPADKFDIFINEIDEAVEKNIGMLRFCIVFKGGECWRVLVGPKGSIEGNSQVAPYLDKYEYFDKLCGNIDKNISDLETGKLKRIVIDVEIGAIYFSRITANIDLLSMTYDQETVHDRDRDHLNVAAALASALGKLL